MVPNVRDNDIGEAFAIPFKRLQLQQRLRMSTFPKHQYYGVRNG